MSKNLHRKYFSRVTKEKIIVNSTVILLRETRLVGRVSASTGAPCLAEDCKICLRVFWRLPARSSFSQVPAGQKILFL
jgi:hypothetical protein